MSRFFHRLINRKASKVAREWKRNTLKTLLFNVLPKDKPYQLDAVLSFLQANPVDLEDPTRLDLLLPDYPLAIDILGPEYASHYLQASPYVDYSRWALLRERLALKKLRLSDYRCPYVTFHFNEPVDAASMTERLKTFVEAL